MSTDYLNVKVAAAQIAPVFLDREASTAKAVEWIEKAGKQGVQVLGFGEAWLPAYPFWVFMGSPIYSAPFSRQLYANSVEIPSATTDELCRAAKESNVFVVMGLTEKSGGSLYLSQIFISNEGEIVGHRRKLKPTHWERAIWGEGDGSDLFVVPSAYGNIGGYNCWEHLQPMNLMAMNAFNEQIHVASWPAFAIYNKIDPSYSNEANSAASRAYAMATQTYTIHVSAVVDQETVDLLCQGDPEKEYLFETGGGTSEIISPLGGTIGKPIGPKEEGLVIADCDFGVIASAKMSNDSSGHYQRGDVLQLHINTRPRLPVIMNDGEQAVDAEGASSTKKQPAAKRGPKTKLVSPKPTKIKPSTTKPKTRSKVKSVKARGQK